MTKFFSRRGSRGASRARGGAKALGAVVIAFALAACQSEVTPFGSLTSEQGNATAIAITSTYTQGPTSLYVAEFALFNRTDLTCAVLQSDEGLNVEYSNFQAVGGSISGTEPITIGTYTIGTEAEDGSGVQAFQEHSDAKCTTDVDDGASGQITLTRVDDTAIEGSFDIVFQSGSHLKGSFNAPACPVDITSNGNTQTVCK